MTLPVFLVPALPPGEEFVLDGPEGRHAATVKRLRVGEELVLSDGSGTLVRCAVVSVERDALSLKVLDRAVEPEPSLRVVLAQALVKGDRGELAVELATEAGVDGVVPWRAARCVAKWEDGPRGAKALGRWRSTVREAAKQARRSRVPFVDEPVSTAQLSQRVSSSALTLVLHESATDRLSDVDLPESGDVLLVVGPEGGITPDELEALRSSGARIVRLGPTVLRASTAAAVALGALGVLTSRW
ncbi:16S rRNA (uracil(1498)-N(3))-methyltransferase [Lentzea flava]|uniref:Ribosomal RNA small subunit methyltransferase E n=1 Tax=Lentzea flava TaxID=103732 RepID=A0ABQ2UVB5_9PSEU|nr:16S rRNA (uracil(1498)-N(3))-methyltransferase [Lentzea flava]MCP2200754.1 16S rRNA (uracil1498-N3)-methyltransferase [Lentzea flava]GGU55362.1 ribosomal RNA small subunit methyltransferase E [Lentzea flava]